MLELGATVLKKERMNESRVAALYARVSTTDQRRTDGSSSDPLDMGSVQVGEMFTAKELQQLLKISIKTIYRYAQRGLIPYVRIQSNLRFPKRRILEWIDRQSYQPRPHDGSAARKR